MSDVNKRASDYFQSKPETKSLFYAKEDKEQFLFEKKQDAVNHAAEVNSDSPDVIEIKNGGSNPTEQKLTPAELKALKDKAIAEYTEFFGETPKGNLSGAKIQALVDAKKAEIANEQNP